MASYLPAKRKNHLPTHPILRYSILDCHLELIRIPTQEFSMLNQLDSVLVPFFSDSKKDDE